MFAFPVNPTYPFFDLANAMAAAAAGCPPGATACATAGRKPNSASSKKAPSTKPAPAPAPTPKSAPVDVVAVETDAGWAYSIDLPGRPLATGNVDIEVVASTDGGAPHLVITAPSVPGGGGKRSRGALHIAFDLERDADAHSVAANAADGELVISVRRLEPVKPVKIKVAIGGGAASTEEAVAPVAAPADGDAAANNDDEDGSWVDDDDDGSAKGGAPKKSGVVLEAVDDE